MNHTYKVRRQIMVPTEEPGVSERVTFDAVITIDIDKLMSEMGDRSVLNKSRKARAHRGAIVVAAQRISTETVPNFRRLGSAA